MRTKLILAGLILMLGTAATSNAQSFQQTRFGAYLNIGMASQAVESADAVEAENTATVSIGGMAFIHVTKRLLFRPGLGLTYASVKQRDYWPIFPCDITPMGTRTRQSYVDSELQFFQVVAPLLFNVSFKDELGGFYLVWGFEPRVKFSESTNITIVECGTEARPFENNPYTNLRTFNLSANLGPGYAFILAEGSVLYVEPTFKFGIIELFEEADLISDPLNNSRLLEFGVNIAYQF